MIIMLLAFREARIGCLRGATSLLVDWPRIWMYDQAHEDIHPETTQFLILDVAEPNVPVTTFSFMGFNTGTLFVTPYTQSSVVRNAMLTYYANSLIHELLDLSGNLYVMQSYARLDDPDLTYGDLKNSAHMVSQLDFLTGWGYGVVRLTWQFYNVPDGNAFLVRDTLAHSYMTVDSDLSCLPVGIPYRVPAPLYVFGASAAFGSRRLRVLIK